LSFSRALSALGAVIMPVLRAAMADHGLASRHAEPPRAAADFSSVSSPPTSCSGVGGAIRRLRWSREIGLVVDEERVVAGAAGRWCLRRLTPHSAAWRALQPTESQAGGRPLRPPRRCRCRI